MLISAHRSHTFVCSTARWFGFESRVTLNNKTGIDGWVMAELYSAQGTFIGRTGVLGIIPNDTMFTADIAEIERSITGANSTEERNAIFSIIPSSVRRWNEMIELEPKEVFRRFGIQDHYIEHYNPQTGYSTGVLYQSVPMNSTLFSTTFSFLMQAPKIFLSDQRNTSFLLIYYSPDDEPVVPEIARVQCKLKNEVGESVVEWIEEVHRAGLVYINVKKVLSEHGIEYRSLVSKHGFAHFEAFCDHASFISCTCNFNEVLETFDIEHSLPPVYYQIGNKSEDRKKVVSYYKNKFFNHDPRESAGATVPPPQEIPSAFQLLK